MTADGQPKPGGRALMDMLRQLLGMDHDAQSAEQQEGDEKGQEGSLKGSGNNSGRGTNGKSNMASSQDKGVSNLTRLWKRVPFPNPPACPQTTCLPGIPQGAGRLQQDFTEVKTPLSGHSPFTHEQQLPVSMKNPRLLLPLS